MTIDNHESFRRAFRDQAQVEKFREFEAVDLGPYLEAVNRLIKDAVKQTEQSESAVD